MTDSNQNEAFEEEDKERREVRCGGRGREGGGGGKKREAEDRELDRRGTMSQIEMITKMHVM